MSDRRAVDTVVALLGLTLLAAVVGVIVLAALHTDTPDVLGQVIVAAIAALGAILVPGARSGAANSVAVSGTVALDPVDSNGGGAG